MIKNARQYANTKKQVALFESAILSKDPNACPEGWTPGLFKAHFRAMESQLETLRREVSEYEALVSGKVEEISLNSLDDLPHGLIKARIARGLNQKQLADLLGVRAQQVQRWEFEDYENVSFYKLVEIAHALNLNVTEVIKFPEKPKPVFLALKDLGLDRAFIQARLVPKSIKQRMTAMNDNDVLAAAAPRLGNVFGVFVDNTGTIRNDGRIAMAGGRGRFKVPANAESERVRAYAVYAHHLANIVAKSTRHIPARDVPQTWRELRSELFGDGAPTFAKAVESCWKLGIPVLPLRDPIRFHGVCWRFDGQNIIVLKQPVQYSSRWLFDLIHELYHAGEAPEANSFDDLGVDFRDPERRESENEKAANQLAGDVLLGGEAENLYLQVMEKAGDNVSWIKGCVERIAESNNVDVGALANYVAYRLHTDHFVEWWGAANNLQPDGDDPFKIARDCLFRSIKLDGLCAEDWEFLEQSLSDPL